MTLIAICALGTGCDLPGRPKPDDRPISANAVVNFEILYRTNCAGCHGVNGNYGPAPPLNDPLFLQLVPEDVLADVIRSGRSGTPMPAFGKDNGGALTEEQVRVLAAGLKPKWLKRENDKSDATAPPPYLADNPHDAESSGELVSAGRAVFARACAGCHGTDGKGGNAGAVHDASFLSLISDQALRRLVITGRPDLGMPTYFGDDSRGSEFKPLTAQQVSSLVALLADWRTSGPSEPRQPGGEAHDGAK